MNGGDDRLVLRARHEATSGAPRLREALVLVEARQGVPRVVDREVRLRLDHECGEPPVLGDQEVPVERIRKEALSEGGQVVRFAGPLFHQVPNDQLVVLAPNRADAHQAGDLFDVGNLALEVRVQCPELAEELEIENVGRLDGDQDDFFSSELLHEALVRDQHGIVPVEEVIKGRVDREAGELRGKAQGDEQHERDRRPGVSEDPMPPALEAGVDAAADSQGSSVGSHADSPPSSAD